MISKDMSGEKKTMCFVQDEETERVLKSLSFTDLGFVGDVQRGDINFAVKYIKENGSPDIVVIDISDVSLPISQIALLVDACEPHTEIIAIGAKNEVGLFRDLMRIGVRDYVVKPIPAAIFIKTLQNVATTTKEAEQLSYAKTGKVIAVVGATGGVGVSSIVANLAVGLSEQRMKRVAVFDFDFYMGSIFQYLDIDKSSGLPQLLEAPERIEPTFIERYMTQYSSNLRVLNTEFPLKSSPSVKSEAVEPIIKALSMRFHFTLLDIPRSIYTDFNMEALMKANIIMIVTDYSLSSLKNISYILELFRDRPHSGQEIIIVANKKNEYVQGEINRELFEETIEKEISFEIPFDAKFPLKALKEGVPVIIEGEGTFAKGINGLINTITGSADVVVSQKEGILEAVFRRIGI